jgi:hypothetical protein
MKLSIIIAPLALASTALAWNPSGPCLSDVYATKIVNDFISILEHTGNANATAQALLADNYTEQGDSINIIAGRPVRIPFHSSGPDPHSNIPQLGTNSFTNKTAYIASVLAAPPITNITTLDIVHNCNKIVWNWLFTSIGKRIDQVKGFDMFTISEQGQILFTHVEFNSIAWAVDVGWNFTRPPPRHSKRHAGLHQILQMS